MGQKRRRLINTQTGEIAEWVDLDGQKPRIRKTATVHYGTVYLPNLDELAQDASLTAGDLRVLLHLMARAPLGECTTTNGGDLVRRLGLNRSTAYRALDHLLEVGAVIRDPDDRHCLWVNPELFWRGDALEQRKQQKRLASA